MMKHIKILTIALFTVALLYSCGPAEGDFPGHEYMPDMGHSIAYEANTYTDYYYNTWDEASTFKTYRLSQVHQPLPGTVPRGYAGVALAPTETAQNAMMDMLQAKDGNPNSFAIPVNGYVPYYYEDTEEERLRATAEIIGNPYPITTEGLIRGQELYRIFCGICHGEEGNGLGYIANDEENPNVVYPVQPANLLNEQFTTAGNGLMYHVIMYGKNAMGAYADKLSYEERWQVIHWVRKLQADALGVEYNGEVNTFNPAFGTPGDGAAGVFADDFNTDKEEVPLINLQPEFEVNENNQDEDDDLPNEEGEGRSDNDQ